MLRFDVWGYKQSLTPIPLLSSQWTLNHSKRLLSRFAYAFDTIRDIDAKSIAKIYASGIDVVITQINYVPQYAQRYRSNYQLSLWGTNKGGFFGKRDPF